MGQRGSIAGSQAASRQHLARHPTVSRLPSVAPINPAPVPRAPRGLKATGRKAWLELWAECPWLDAGQDAMAASECCRLVDDLAALRAVIERDGWTVSTPVITPKGEVLNERRIELHPAEAALRRAETQLLALLDRLGAQPQARARLGITTLQLRKGVRKHEQST
jgi:P27 family predicted phage terminase small subunit